MKVEVGVATDIGRTRQRNDDSFLVEPPLYAVADGMGGHRGGDVASQLALETIETLFREDEGSLAEQVREANRAVFDRSQEDTSVKGMGTTLTAALVEGSRLKLAHVGDSRAYLMRAGSLRQLTSDHTLVARMVKTGEISAAEAEVHPHRNVLTRSLGTEAAVQVDEDLVGLLDGDRVLLCSDGLTGMVAEDQIKAILETEPDPQRASNRLIKAANGAGGVDNITVLVLDAIGEEGDTAGEPGGDPRGWRPWVLGTVAVLIVLVGAFFALRLYVDRQWYVGVADGRVAVLQGIPASPLGMSLSTVDTTTDIPASDALALELWRELGQGINAENRDAAFTIVEQIRTDVEGAAEPKEPNTQNGGGGGQ